VVAAPAVTVAPAKPVPAPAAAPVNPSKVPAPNNNLFVPVK